MARCTSAAVTDLIADLLDQCLCDAGRRPIRGDAGELEQEPGEYLLPMRRVQDLGVVLHAGESTRPILEGGHRGPRAGGHYLEPVRRRGDGVTVTHPHRLGVGEVRMQLTPNDFQFGAAVFAGTGVRNGTAERLGHCLKSVADTEHRHTKVEQRRVELRCAFGVHAGWAAG
jgi:hypothetical protein